MPRVSSLNPNVGGLNPGHAIALYPYTRNFTLSSSPCIQVYKWVPTSMGYLHHGLASGPGEVAIFSDPSYYTKWVSLVTLSTHKIELTTLKTSSVFYGIEF